MVAGGTGFIGTALARVLNRRAHQVTVLTRTPKGATLHYSALVWNPAKPIGLEQVLNGYDAVVNLAGAPVADRRWSAAYRQEILNSRLASTDALMEVISRCRKKPQVLINASAIGYYGAHGDEKLTEDSKPSHGFLTEVCRRWEESALKAESLGLRVVRLRTGIVLGKNGGVLKKMVLPFKFGLGGPMGTGDQWMSWIHIEDMVGMIVRAIEDVSWQGAYNAVAPHPVTNRDFSKTLAKVLFRPCFMRVPAWALKFLLGDMAEEMLLSGQRVVPARAKSMGFGFRHPDLEHALRALDL